MEEIVKNEFQFYSKLAKPLVLNLPKSKGKSFTQIFLDIFLRKCIFFPYQILCSDRILAAAWITKLREEDAGDERLRTVYLKLLLFCLQRRRLTGIFADDPANYDMLEALPQDIDVGRISATYLFCLDILKLEANCINKILIFETCLISRV